MRHLISLACLLVFFFPISCGYQDRELKEKSRHRAKGTEIHRTGHEKSSPFSKHNDHVPGQILVRFRHGTDKQTMEAVQRELHLVAIKIVSRPNLYLMKILNGSSVEEIMERLKDFPEVEYSEPNYVRKAF